MFNFGLSKLVTQARAVRKSVANQCKEITDIIDGCKLPGAVVTPEGVVISSNGPAAEHKKVTMEEVRSITESTNKLAKQTALIVSIENHYSKSQQAKSI